jgi:hypothetical protein
VRDRALQPVSGHDETTASAAGLAPGGRLQLAAVALAGVVVIVIGVSQGPTIGLAALAVAVVGLWTVERPQIIGYVLVAVVPAAAGLGRGLVVPQLRLSEALVLVGAAVVLPRTLGRADRRWATLDWAAFGFVGCHVVLGLASGLLHDAIDVDGLRLLAGPVQFFLLYRTVSAVLTTVEQRTRAIEVLLAATIPVAIIALLQSAGVGAVQRLIEDTTAGDVFERWGYARSPRATGPFPSWHPLAGFLFLPILVATAVLTRLTGPSKVSRPLALISLPLCVAALLASQTLNVIAGVVLATVIIAVAAGRFVRTALPALIVLVLTFAVVGGAIVDRLETQVLARDQSSAGVGTPQTIGYRFEVWQEQYLPVVRDYWVAGYGPGLPSTIEWRSTESLYLTLLIRGGLGLLLAYAAFMVVVLESALRGRRSDDPVHRLLAYVFVGSIIALVPMQALFPYFTASGLPQVFWVLLALFATSSPQEPSATGTASGLRVGRHEPI